MVVRWKGCRVQANIGHSVDPGKWVEEIQRVKANTTHGKHHTPASKINADIQRYEDAAEDAFLHFASARVEPTAEEYREKLRCLLGKNPSEPSSPLMSDLFLEYISKEGAVRSWAKRTAGLKMELRQSFVEFDPSLRLSDFDGGRMQEFFFWMTNGKGLANRTVRERMSSVRAFLRWAQRAGYPADPGAIEFQPRIKVLPKTVVFLNWEELQTLVAYRESESLKDGWRDVLDWFLLSCFTGLRKSDLANLRWSDIGENHIRTVTHKTGEPLYIDLNRYSRMFLEKHKGEGERVLPDIEHLNPNLTIKRVCRDAGISEPVTIVEYAGGERKERVSEKWREISMHSGRRTFVCNALSLGISPQTIMKWTGHRDYESMKPYIDVSDADRAAAMSKFDK